jgi:hypothetical protein
VHIWWWCRLFMKFNSQNFKVSKEWKKHTATCKWKHYDVPKPATLLWRYMVGWGENTNCISAVEWVECSAWCSTHFTFSEWDLSIRGIGCWMVPGELIRMWCSLLIICMYMLYLFTQIYVLASSYQIFLHALWPITFYSCFREMHTAKVWKCWSQFLSECLTSRWLSLRTSETGIKSQSSYRYFIYTNGCQKCCTTPCVLLRLPGGHSALGVKNAQFHHNTKFK